MTGYEISIVLISLITITITTLYSYLKKSDIETSQEYIEEFFKTATSALKDETISNSDKNLIIFMTETVSTHFSILLTIKSMNTASLKDIKSKSLHPSKKVLHAVALWPYCSSYRSVVIGRMIRSQLSNLIALSSQKKAYKVIKLNRTGHNISHKNIAA